MAIQSPALLHDQEPPRTTQSTEERCVALALHLGRVAAAHLVCHTIGHPQRSWSAFRDTEAAARLPAAPDWEVELGGEALIVIGDTHTLPGFSDCPIHSLVRIRMYAIDQHLLGVLWLLDTVAHEFSADDRAAFEHLAQLTTVALIDAHALDIGAISQAALARLRALLRNATDLVSINDARGIIQYISPSVTRILGYQPEELIGRSSFDFLHPDDIAAIVASAGRAAQTRGTSLPVQMRFRNAHGRWRILEASSTNMLDDPYVQGMVVNARDITEQVQAEDKLRVNDTTLKTISQGVLLTGPDRRIRSVNDAFMAITGYSQAEILGQPCHFLQGPQTDPQTVAAIRQCLENQVEFTGEILNYRKDGTCFWNDLTISSVCDEHGSLTHYVGIIRDITERKQNQATLISNELRFYTIIDASPVPMGLNNDQQQIIFLNQAFVQTFGYMQAEIPTLEHWWTQAYPDLQYRNWVIERWQAGLAALDQPDATFTPIEVTIRCKNGTDKTVLASAASVANATSVEYLVVLYDITAQQQAQLQEAKLEAQLYQSQKMESIGRLAGGVAHDFNNMLGVILGHTELMLNDIAQTDPLYMNLQEIQQAAERSANLTHQLLAFARKQTITPKILNLNATVLGMLSMLERMIGENITLVWQPSADLWPISIDPTQIDQILANLCVNARDAITNIGQITITTSNCMLDMEFCALHAECVPGAYVVLAVQDTGCGMDVQTREQIFEPFFTSKAFGQGTGLGLATVYGIVKQNNGYISVASEPGIGTTFQIYLPRHIAAPVTQQGDAQTPYSLPSKGETILLVEDELSILTLGSTILTRLGYHVLAARTPGAAIHLTKAYDGQIDLLITDVIMPEMNGRDLAAQLLPFQPNLMCLFMSGYTADIIAHHGVLDEGKHFIQKPFLLNDFAAKVRQALDRRQSSGAAISW